MAFKYFRLRYAKFRRYSLVSISMMVWRACLIDVKNWVIVRRHCGSWSDRQRWEGRFATKGVLPPIDLVSCVMIGNLGPNSVVTVWCPAAEAQSPPWNQTDVFPPSDDAMA
jgi:hypothetical protein